jgi:hypothetical protein
MTISQIELFLLILVTFYQNKGTAKYVQTGS